MPTVRKLSLLLLLPIILALASCGGSSTSTTTTSPVSPVVKALRAHPCTPTNFYAQCVGPVTPKLLSPGGIVPPTPPKLGASSGQFGIDFAWGGPSGATARSLGAHFGASYLSNSSKDWSFGLAQSYKNAGLGVVFVWESSAARPLDGYSAGYDDAYNASHEAAALGFTHIHIDFAADFDSTNYGSRFVPYYQGAAAYDAHVGNTTGAYGGLHTVATLCNQHVTTLNWQTVAWSGGQWVSPACAPLRQVSIENNWHGYSVDYNIAVGISYGQESAKPPPPPDPHHYLYFYKGPFKIGPHHVKVNERLTVQKYDGARRKPVKYRAYLVHLRHDLGLLARRDYVVAHRHGHKATWTLFHRGFRYQGLIHRSQGKQLVH